MTLLNRRRLGENPVSGHTHALRQIYLRPSIVLSPREGTVMMKKLLKHVNKNPN